MNILYIDTETTGLEAQDNSIIEIAALLEVDGEEVDSFHTKMTAKNGSKISMGALKVNKHSLTAVLNLEDRATALTKFVDWLLSLKLSGPLHICGHNVPFDINYIKESLKEELNVVGWDEAVSYRILDTSTLGTFLIDSGIIKVPENMPKGSSLEKLALSLGLEVRGRKLHSATEDVKLTREVYNNMKKLIGTIGGTK